MSIHDQLPKIKSSIDSGRGHDIMVIITIIGVSIASFGLGAISAKKTNSEVIIEANSGLLLASTADAKSVTGDEKTANSTSSVAKNIPENTTNTGTMISVNSSSSASLQNNKGNFVASNKGKKYYPTNCSGAKSLSPTNLVYFQTKEEAEAKGYSLSTGCK